MKFHDAANIFPLMNDADLERLADDIKAHGQTDAIELLDGKILDGRNRFRACELRGIKPEFMQAMCNGSTPTEYVVSKNLHRRHLSESQRAAVAARLATAPEGRPKKTTAIAVVSQEDAAKMLNVSVDSVQRAKAVIDKGSQELIDAVDKDEIKVSRAAKIAELPKVEQREAVKAGGTLPEKEPEPEAEVEWTDALGNKLPKHAIPMFQGRDLFSACIGHAAALKRAIGELCDAKAGTHITKAPLLKSLRSISQELNDGRPYCLCPYCDGRKCSACKQTGVVTETVWNNRKQKD